MDIIMLQWSRAKPCNPGSRHITIELFASTKVICKPVNYDLIDYAKCSTHQLPVTFC